MEDAVSATRLRIRKRVEQAMNEVIEFFFLHSVLSLSSKQSQLHLKGFQIPHIAREELKHVFSETCSAYL